MRRSVECGAGSYGSIANNDRILKWEFGITNRIERLTTKTRQSWSQLSSSSLTPGNNSEIIVK